MLGLFGTLNLGQRSLQVYRQGVEVAGHNLANVSNPAYARQRIQIQTAPAIESPIGHFGTGAQVVTIKQLRSSLLDAQVQSEASVRGFLEAQETGLQMAQAIWGEVIDRTSSTPLGTNGAAAVSGEHGLAGGLTDLFNAFQSVATAPTSLSERQVLVMKAESLATQFQQIHRGLAELNGSLNTSISAEVGQVNNLLGTIADLNKQILNSEGSMTQRANDLRDLRQARLEELAAFVPVQSIEQPNGMVDVSIGGQTLVTGSTVEAQLQTFDPGTGQLQVRAAGSASPLTLTAGSIAGIIDLRDGALNTLNTDLDTLATTLITEVNARHAAGYSLTGTTGAAFFAGTDASDIAVNAALLGNPALFQASSEQGANGNNEAALKLAQLGTETLGSLGGKTIHGAYGETVARFGQTIASVNSSLADQAVVEQMLLRQRDSVSGVSLDEEMTELIKFQKAFEASAHLITTIDEMLQTVVNLKR